MNAGPSRCSDLLAARSVYWIRLGRTLFCVTGYDNLTSIERREEYGWYPHGIICSCLGEKATLQYHIVNEFVAFSPKKNKEPHTHISSTHTKEHPECRTLEPYSKLSLLGSPIVP